MTLYEFLVKMNVDIKDNNSVLGNNLSGELARFKIKIDFNKDICNVTDDELYQIGRNIFFIDNCGRKMFGNEIVDEMKDFIKKNS